MEIELTVPDDVEEAFRRQAMGTFGHRRGSMSEAGERALRQWAAEVEAMNGAVVLPEDPVDAIRGVLPHVEIDPVALQHGVGDRRYDGHHRTMDRQGEDPA